METLEGALGRWTSLAEAAGQATGFARAAPVVEEPIAPVVEDDVVVSEQEGVHVSTSASVEDVSAAFGDAAEGGAVAALEADESVADEVFEEIDLGFGDEGGEVELALVKESRSGRAEAKVGQEPEAGFGEGRAEVQLALVGDGAGEAEGAEIEIAAGDEGVDNRRALLLYQEGTPEEQIYPFTGDVLTVGRGRDNDIQIKNDSKVSRYHCKVFRRGANFYIEDNKSSNGTLVNGELVTERRLFGGEEVIIGETFFRFRIME
jgi:hypothetical protein